MYCQGFAHGSRSQETPENPMRLVNGQGQLKVNKIDAGRGSNGICRVIDASPDVAILE